MNRALHKIFLITDRSRFPIPARYCARKTYRNPNVEDFFPEAGEFQGSPLVPKARREDANILPTSRQTEPDSLSQAASGSHMRRDVQRQRRFHLEPA
jgi:hypothetical protein